MVRKYQSQMFCLLAFVMVIALTSCSKSASPDAASNSSSTSASNTPAAGNAASGSSNDIDACKLVTKAEVEEAFGEKLKDPDSGPASMAGGTICMFQSPDSMSAKNVTLRVESPNYNWAKVKEDKRIEGERMRPTRGYIRQVPGLGKDAYFARHALHVLTDKGILTVSAFKDAGDAVSGEEKENKAERIEKILAEKAVPRM
ncbi:MAG TPA: DUF3558 family protein [Candidatus Angelobacter sp.]|nr:DUF3558 family protein [Candidatus Angelobacter sp.]